MQFRRLGGETLRQERETDPAAALGPALLELKEGRGGDSKLPPERAGEQEVNTFQPGAGFLP